MKENSQTGVDVVVGQGYFGGHIGQLVKILAARPECDTEAEKSCRSCVQREDSVKLAIKVRNNLECLSHYPSSHLSSLLKLRALNGKFFYSPEA